MTKELLQRIIKDSKNPQNWHNFFRAASSYYSKDENIYLEPPKDSRFSNLKSLGDMKFEGLDKVIVARADVSQGLSERSGKKAQYEEAKRVLKSLVKYSAGLFIFIDPEGRFRMSLVYAQYDGPKVEFNNFRRFTYFVDQGQTNRTFRDRLTACKFHNIESIKDAFSVEKVNKEFYEKIALFFDKLVGKNNAKPELRMPDNINSTPAVLEEFSVRLIGRIVFCWFLKHKKSSRGIPLIPDVVLSSQAVIEQYYHMVLEKLFFEVMNKRVDERLPDIGNFIPSHATIPFLNGGLFEPHVHDLYEGQANWGLVIPHEWFTDFFELLESYNFTIDENSPIDAEVSVDPEMMGRIFENLLAAVNPETGESARKASGSYYTPRVIVDYMVEQTITQYLQTKTTLNDEQIQNLLSYEMEIADWDANSRKAVVDAFQAIKILDPACGSGAFPMGILHRLILALEKVDPQLEIWREQYLSALDSILRQRFEKDIKRENWAYIRKLTIIREAIYGVDIQPIAVEIAKLRCFLSLIVDEVVSDEESNRGIEPLPNLEFKFVAANSLIGLPGSEIKTTPKTKTEGHSPLLPLGEENVLINDLACLRKEYFTSYGARRKTIEEEFSKIQRRIFKIYIDTAKITTEDLLGAQEAKHDKTASQAQLLSAWRPFSNEASVWFDPAWMFGIEDGFDIVIGNPPYIQLQKEGGKLGELYKDYKYKTFERTGDIYALFYEKGIELLTPGGHLCYISSNKWMRTAYGKSLRKYFASKNPLLLIDLGPDVFDNATVDTCILLIQNTENGSNMKGLTLAKEDKGKNLAELINKNAVDIQKLTEKTWFIGSGAEYMLKLRIEAAGVPLKDWDININYGIKTGLNEAFIIDTATKEKLCAEDPKSAEILKPILRGRDIKRYYCKWTGLWLIASGYDVDVPKLYPAIHRHLKNYQEKATRRADQGENWWNLRACAYYAEFEKEKIVWSDIACTPNFSLLPSGIYFNNTAYMISANYHRQYMCGVLNSKVTSWYFPNIATDLGEKGFRYFKQFVELLPVPRPEKVYSTTIGKVQDFVNQITSLKKQDKNADTQELEREIDQLVYQLYDLSPEEIAIVEKSVKM